MWSCIQGVTEVDVHIQGGESMVNLQQKILQRHRSNSQRLRRCGRLKFKKVLYFALSKCHNSETVKDRYHFLPANKNRNRRQQKSYFTKQWLMDRLRSYGQWKLQKKTYVHYWRYVKNTVNKMFEMTFTDLCTYYGEDQVRFHTKKIKYVLIYLVFISGIFYLSPMRFFFTISTARNFVTGPLTTAW